MVLTLLTLAAQQTSLTGVVRDTTSLEPIAFAEVRVSSSRAVARTAAGTTDRFGAFAIPSAPAGPVRVEAGALRGGHLVPGDVRDPQRRHRVRLDVD